MRKYLLNLKKVNNYAFFCPQSRMHLTISNPVGYADRVTPAIERGLKSHVIIDITDEEEANIQPKKEVKETKQTETVEPKTEVKTETVPTVEVRAEEVVEEPKEEVKTEEVKETKTTTKRGRKSSK